MAEIIMEQNCSMEQSLSSLPKSRLEALKLGAKRFFTGKPCSKGHLAFRYSSGGACSECMNLNSLVYWQRRPGLAAKRAAEKRAARTEGDRIKNRADRRNKFRDMVQSDPVGRWCVHSFWRAKSYAKKKGLPFDLSVEFVRSICTTHCPALGLELVYCNPKHFAKNSAQLDRREPRLGYVKSNVRVISQRANLIKSDATVDEIGGVYHWLSSSLSAA